MSWKDWPSVEILLNIVHDIFIDFSLNSFIEKNTFYEPFL